MPAGSSIDRRALDSQETIRGRLGGWFRTRPEWFLLVASVAVELAHIFPIAALLLSLVLGALITAEVWRRRRHAHRPVQPDYFAASTAVVLFGGCVATLRLLSENGSMGLFLLVVFVALASVRVGRTFGARLDVMRATTRLGRRAGSVTESVLLLTPLMFLGPLAGIDMGLFLVLVFPLAFATLLAMGVRTARWYMAPLIGVMLMVILLGWRVVLPSVRHIQEAESHADQAAAFANMSKLFGVPVPFMTTPLDRAASRSVATRDREMAEALLVAASPGAARDLLIPSIEQVWGTTAYANAGLIGEGLGRAVVGGRGVAETVSYAENTFSVFVLAEHGAVGGVLVLALYALLTGAILASVRSNTGDLPSYRASRALFVVAGLIVAFPAVYVALSNIGVLPITGQNMPFLGLNAWSDVTLCAGVVGILITGALRGLEESRR